MSIFSKIGKSIKKVVKKVGKYVAPVAAIAAPFLAPGLGQTITGAIGKVGGLLGGSSASSNAFTGPPDPANPTEGQQVNVQASGGNSWAKAIGDALPAAATGLAGYLGQKETNVASAEQAQRQMDFQAQQTGTSYQRAVADMKAAGLNPMLAYSQGGAASGSGASAPVGNELGAGANSAWQAAQAKQQMQQSQAQIENIIADTSNKEQQTTNLQSENLYTLARTTSEGTKNHELAQRVAQIALQNQLAASTQDYSISSAKSGAERAASEAEGSRYSLAEKRAWSRFYESAVGRAYPYASKVSEQANSAANVFRKFIPFTND